MNDILPSKFNAAQPSPLTRIDTRELNISVQPGSFFSLFVQLNHLHQVTSFLFRPGMRFNDAGQWWGTKKRVHPHEGIDIFLMQHEDMRTSTVLPKMPAPAMLAGEVVHFHRDFLGETLYIRHAEIRQKNTILHTLYGHLHLDETIMTQVRTIPPCPFFINRGQIVGTLSAPLGKSIVPAHLHISCAWIHEDLPVSELNWEGMSNSTNVQFIDPLPFLL